MSTFVTNAKNENRDSSRISIEKRLEEILKSQNAALENKQQCDIINHEYANNTEQYSRRNNIRIAGVPEDQDRQSSVSVTQKFVTLVNSHLGIPIQPYDVDIAHRLGKFRPNSNRTLRNSMQRYWHPCD
ncbi:hypothetical protein DPMN_015865 [Dreissena polymorpha]|uniref:Uncharacterized protein n=1 Tax=Dreissena polymorpha TaxID=45954 RepID=A0A9D4NC33_DREPO|nr:hypothetical protein DPMN_015865 [Dreissena polymorpha]